MIDQIQNKNNTQYINNSKPQNQQQLSPTTSLFQNGIQKMGDEYGSPFDINGDIKNFEKFGNFYDHKAQNFRRKRVDGVHDYYQKLMEKHKNLKFNLGAILPEPSPGNFDKGRRGYVTYKRAMKTWEENCIKQFDLIEEKLKDQKPDTHCVIVLGDNNDIDFKLVVDTGKNTPQVQEETAPKNPVPEQPVVDSSIPRQEKSVNDNNGKEGVEPDTLPAALEPEQPPKASEPLAPLPPEKKVEIEPDVLPENLKPEQPSNIPEAVISKPADEVNQPQESVNNDDKITTKPYQVKKGDYWFKVVQEKYNVNSAEEVHEIVRKLKDEYFEANKKDLIKAGYTSSKSGFFPRANETLELPELIKIGEDSYSLK